MTDTLDFSDESRERSILRRAEYDDTDPRDLMLVIPTREGGKLRVPLLERARSISSGRIIRKIRCFESSRLPKSQVTCPSKAVESGLTRGEASHFYAPVFFTFFEIIDSGVNWK